MADALDPSLGALAETLDSLLGTLAETLDSLLGALTETLDSLLGALTETLDAPSSALTDILNCASGALPGAPDRVPGVGQQIMGAATDVAQGVADALEQLRIAVERGEHALQDPAYVVQAHLHQCLCLDALYVELDLAQSDSDPGVDLNEMPGLGEHRKVSPEIIQLKLDLVDFDHWGVDVDIDGLIDVAGIYDGIVRNVIAGARAPTVARARLASA